MYNSRVVARTLCDGQVVGDETMRLRGASLQAVPALPDLVGHVVLPGDARHCPCQRVCRVSRRDRLQAALTVLVASQAVAVAERVDEVGHAREVGAHDVERVVLDGGWGRHVADCAVLPRAAYMNGEMVAVRGSVPVRWCGFTLVVDLKYPEIGNCLGPGVIADCDISITCSCFWLQQMGGRWVEVPVRSANCFRQWEVLRASC